MAPPLLRYGNRHPIAAYYLSVDPEGMIGWVGMVGWPIADGLPTYVFTLKLQVERRESLPAKDRRSTAEPRIQLMLVVGLITTYSGNSQKYYSGWYFLKSFEAAVNLKKTHASLCVLVVAWKPVTAWNVCVEQFETRGFYDH